MKLQYTKPLLALALGLSLCVGGTPARAQDAPSEPVHEVPLLQKAGLINLDTPAFPAPHSAIFNFDARIFGGSEELTYLNAGVQVGLSSNLAGILRLGGVNRRYHVEGRRGVMHGGQEVEVAGKLRLHNVRDFGISVQGGVIFPNTPTERSPFLAAEVMFTRDLGEKTSLYLVPKVLFASRELITLGGGVSYRLNGQWMVMGDVQGVLSGSNTFHLPVGQRVRQEVWGVGFRYTPMAYGGRYGLDFGVTNGLGRTLGLSAQSALSGSSSFYLNLTYHH